MYNATSEGDHSFSWTGHSSSFFNDPGHCTAFIEYEWTSTEKGANRHRVVIYRDRGAKASMVEPCSTVPPLGSPDERELWKWMEGSELKTDDMLQYEYGREALAIGLQLEKKLGVNPYKFGLIGSTDSHTGLATAQEDNSFGKHSGAEPSAERVSHPMAKGSATRRMPDGRWSALAWPLSGPGRTRGRHLFDALQNKETDATTGSRMMVRFFGGWDFPKEDAQNRLPANVVDSKGVPMVTVERADTSPISYTP